MNPSALPFLYGTAWKKDLTADLVVQAVLAGFRGDVPAALCSDASVTVASVASVGHPPILQPEAPQLMLAPCRH